MSGPLEKAMALVSKQYRSTVVVLVLVGGLLFASFSAWATANARGEAFVDKCIETKVGPQLATHEKAISDLTSHQSKYDTDIAEIHTDIAVIRQTLVDLKERR